MKRKIKKEKNESGMVVLLAAITLSIFTIMATTEISYRSVQENTKIDHISGKKAELNALAGLERSKRLLELGENPTIQDLSFNNGTIDIYTDPNTNVVTSTGRFQDAVVAHSIQAQFAKDCLEWNLENAHTATDKIVSAKLNTLCNPMPSVVIDKLKVEWTDDVNDNISQIHITGIGSPEFDAPPSKDNGEIIDINDYNINSNGQIPITHFQFDTNPVLGARTYTLTAYLKDGSSITDSFVDPTPAVPATPPFEITNNGLLDVDDDKTMSLEVLGSAISCGAGGSEINVKVWYKEKGQGSWSSWQGLWDNADVDGGETFNDNTGNGTKYKFKAQAWLNSCSNFSQTYYSNQSAQVKMLVNGEQAPALAGFGGQKPITAFLAPYLNESGIVQLSSNQVILLWELGVNMTYNPGSPAADFQDLVLLVTVNDE